MKLADYFAETGESQEAFGQRLSPPVTQSAVAQWLKGTPIKAERVLDAAAKTGWKVTPHDWRADLYRHPDDGMPKPLVLTGIPSESEAALVAGPR